MIVLFNNYLKILRIPSIVIVLLILFVPDDIFSVTSFVDFKTPINIYYKWLDGSASYIFIPFVFFLFKKKMKREHLVLLLFWFVLLLWNLVKAFFVESFLINNSNFELFYGLLVGIVLIIFIEMKLKSLRNLELFFEIFMFSQILGLFLGILLGEGLDGRYHPPNLDVGTTGLFLGVFFIHNLFVKQKPNPYILVLIFISIILTGSRAHIILLLFFLIFYFFNKIKNFINIKFFLLLILLFYFLDFSFIFNNFEKIEFFDLERITNLIEISQQGNINEDDSVLGRINSLEVGIKVLKEYPLGTFFSFIDLQWLMQANGYGTFPHSTILAFYLVLGPFFIIISIFFIKLFFLLIRYSNKYYYLLLYLIVASVFFGGMFVNFKIFFFYLLVFKIASHSSKTNQIKINTV